MRISYIACYWADQLHFFDDTILDFYDMQCILDYISSSSMFFFNKPSHETFNLVHYDTYYGNFAHCIRFKLSNMFHDQLFNQCFSYFFILFLVRYNFNLDLNAIDYYGETPLQSLHLSGSSITNTLHFNILNKLLDPSYCIVTVAQSFVRRWLAVRSFQRLKFKYVLEHILLSPPGQIQFSFFPFFPGGQYYLQSFHHFLNTLPT